MLIAIPSSAVIAGFYTFYLAVSTDDGLVADDYYKQGMTINRQIQRDEVALQLQLAAEAEVDAATGFVKVVFDKGSLEQYPTSLKLGLRHATQQQQDNFIVLQRGIDNQYVGAITTADQAGIRVGVWYLVLSNAEQDGARAWRLTRRARLQGLTAVTFRPE
jgi:hypothetical protein